MILKVTDNTGDFVVTTGFKVSGDIIWHKSEVLLEGIKIHAWK